MPDQPESRSAKYRAWVRARITEINLDPPPTSVHKRTAHQGRYGPYDPKYQLNLRWLAELISEDMDGHLSRTVVFGTLRENARSLPREPALRQDLLDTTQKVLARCARIARHEIDLTMDLVTLCMPEASVIPPGLNPLGFDPEALGFFRISSWNPNRKMIEGENVGGIAKITRSDVILQHRQTEGWIRDQQLFDRLLAQAKAASEGRPCPSLVSYRPDEREGGDTNKLYLNVSKSIYHKHVAIRNYLRADHAAYEAARRRIKEHFYVDGRSEGLRDIIRVAPESNIVINVTVQSRDGSVMLIRRPTGAIVWRSFYQVGAHETMNWPELEPPQEPFEDWFMLARRALREEIGIVDPADYNQKIIFSWFGFYAPECSGYFFAHVQTRLTESELVESVLACQGVVEADAIEWLRLDAGSVQRVLRTWAKGPWEDDAISDEQGRRWLPHATMSLTQLLRVTRQKMFADNEL